MASIRDVAIKAGVGIGTVSRALNGSGYISDETKQKIMQAVATAKTSAQWLREGGRFIPNPSTWINQGRWDDEPLPPAGSGSYQQRPGGNCGKPDTMDVLAGIIADEEGGFEI